MVRPAVPTPITPAVAGELLIHQYQGCAALRQPEVTFRKPVLPGNLAPKAQAVPMVFIYPRQEGQIVSKGGALCKRGSGSGGQWIGADPLRRALSAAGQEGGSEGPRGGAAEGAHADKAITKASCKTPTKDL